MEISIMHHVGIVLFSIWLFSYFNLSHPLVYLVSLFYLYLVHERYVMRLRRKLQFEERRQSNQRRVLSDSETVRWLNHAVEKIWPICMEQIASQKILLPIIPWFLEKYKPWTAKQAMVQHLYLGRNPPMFTEMRVLGHNTDDDHLVLELGMNFLTADDMSAILDVKLRKRLGFGMWAKLHLTGMHVEGKVLIGVKFLRQWPFLGRLRVCFAEPPYFQMTVKPLFTHGLDVTELPGIAGWLDKLLSIAFEQTLVEPNMLVVDVEKFTSPQPGENWFSVDVKEPIAYAKVEVVEASDMKPSDLNGLADPYVKGQLGPYRFRTKTHKKTLTPKWNEEFKIPICTWETSNMLSIEVRDKDHFVDDNLGDCSVNISDLRDGQRHDMWLPLQNVKIGRLHLAITVLEDNAKEVENPYGDETFNKEDVQINEDVNKEDVWNSFANESANKGSFSSDTAEKSPKVADKFEPINIEGQRETGIWVHHPGSEVVQTWEPRKGKSRRLDTQIHTVPNDSFGSTNLPASGPLNSSSSSSNDENHEGRSPMKTVRWGLRKIGSVFNRSPKKEDHSGNSGEAVEPLHPNLRAVNSKEIGMKFIVEDSLSGLITDKNPKEISVDGPFIDKNPKEISVDSEGSGPESPGKGHMKGMAKSILKHAGKHARNITQVLSRKGSRKFRGDSSGMTEQENFHGDMSEDESLSSPRDGRVPVFSNSVSSSSGNDELYNTKEPVVQTNLRDLAMEIEGETKKSVEDQERKDDDDEVSKPERSNNGEIESSETSISEENLKGKEDSKVGLVENQIS